MKEHRQALRTAVIVAVVVLAVTVLLVVLFFGGAAQTQQQSITLPEPSAAQPQEEEPAEAAEPNLFAEVTRENVQAVLRSLARPSSYHQTLTVLTYAGESSRQQQVDIWRSGDLLRADLTDENGVKSILTDGESVYLWYDGDETALALPLREGVRAEELIGIPTYETILAIDVAQIEGADFVTLEEPSQLACIFVSFVSDGCTQYYWIDVQSGLLCRQTMLQNDSPLYIMQQARLDVLAEGDEALSDAFCLPDGSEPFAAR